MPTRRPREPLLVLAAVAVAVTAVLIALGGRSGGARAGAEPTWRGLAGAQRVRVAVGQRVIVVLKAPALADRVGSVGGLATDEEERQWTQAALSSQRLLIARLRVQGVVAQPEFSYTRTINGFSAAFDARGIALLERAPEVAGIYPVRVAYPASLSSAQSSAFAQRPDVSLGDEDGRGVTVALLDTGVDRSHPFLRGRVEPGIDIVGSDANATAAPNPDEPAQLEDHGTAMAGLVVGSGGPGELRGVAPGRRCSRSGSRAGSATHPRAGRCTDAPTSCSRASSARSIRTPTVTHTTRRESPWWASPSRSPPSPTGPWRSP